MRPLKHLNKYLYKYRWRLILGVFFIAISRLFSILPAQIIRYATDLISEDIHIGLLLHGHAFADFQTAFFRETGSAILFMAGLILLSACINGLFLFFTRQTIIIMSRLIEFDLKNEIYAHYQKLSAAFYKRHNTGDLMNRISEDVSRVRMYLGPAIMYSINVLVLFIFVISAMLKVNPELTFYVLTPLPILSIIIYYVSDLINKKSEKVQKQLSVLSTIAQETFAGIRVLKAYLREPDMHELYKRECQKYKEDNLGLAKVQALFQPMMILLIGISTALTVYVGGMLVISGEITTGNIAEFVIYVNMLTWPVAAIGWVTSLVQRAAASQKRINEFLRTQPQIVNPSTNSFTIRGHVTFRNVSFTYPDTGIRAIDHLSFSVSPGESLGVIGKTGSGKSTIANLLCRIYEPDEGEILIDGRKIETIKLNDLRIAIGYVPQDGFLFSDRIANNISFGNHVDAEDKALIVEAAKISEVHDEITRFPQAYQTIIGERGVTLSGGQKQRVALARAIIKNPSILLLDDSLSALDTETEEKVLRNLRPVMRKASTMIFSHRVSSLIHCDNIMVIDHGKAVEFGKHLELIDKKGVYFDLFQAQLMLKPK